MAKNRTPKANHDPQPVAPVEVTVQPVTRAACCGQPVTYPRSPGAASAALTDHIQRAHGKDYSLLAVLTGTA